MSDLIDRQAAIDAIQKHLENVLGGYEYDEGVAFVYAAAHNHIIDVVKRLPSAQPERKTGRWIDDNCSECGQYVYHGDARNYCPNCGAHMMEGEG